MRRFSCFAFVLVLASSFGCSGSQGSDSGQSGTETSDSDPCSLLEGEVVPAASQTPLGTPEAIATQFSATHDTSLRYWIEGGNVAANTLPGTIMLTVSNLDARFVSGEGTQCAPRMKLDATLEVHTDDGTFDDVFLGRLEVQTLQSASFVGQLPATSAVGTFATESESSPGTTTYTVSTMVAPELHGHMVQDSTDNASAGTSEVATSRYVAEWPAM